MKKLQLWTVVAMLTGVGSALVLGQASGPQNSQAADALAGKLADGSNYRVVKPAQWNGTLVLDLDFINNPSAPPSAIEQWMVANGYAIGGISREPIAYRFPQAVDDLLTVRTMFINRWGAPKRTLSLGNSRGAFVSRIALERRPDIFVGALMSAGGGAGEVALHNAKLDALWALKQFSGVPLMVAGFSSQAEAAAEGMKIQEAVKTLQATPIGRARLALAAAFEQLPVWADGDQPPADTDYEAQVDQLAIGFGPATRLWCATTSSRPPAASSPGTMASTTRTSCRDPGCRRWSPRFTGKLARISRQTCARSPGRRGSRRHRPQSQLPRRPCLTRERFPVRC